MDESTLYGLDTLDFNPDMYYEDEWGTLGNLNSDKSSNGSNSPKIKLSRSNSKDILGGVGDFHQSKKNISSFLEHSKDVEGSLRVPSYILENSGKRRSPERSQHSSGKRRGDYDDSFELNVASAGSGSKKKPKSSSSKNIGKSKGSRSPLRVAARTLKASKQAGSKQEG